MFTNYISVIIIIVIIAVIWWQYRSSGSTEIFYTSGASLRDRSEVSESTQQTVDPVAFNNAALRFYIGHPH